MKYFFFEWFLSDHFDLYCHEILWVLHPSLCLETLRILLGPIPVPIQALRMSLTLLHYAYTYKKKVHMLVCFSSPSLPPAIPYNHTSWHTNYWILKLAPNWFSGLLTFFLLSAPKVFIIKLHSLLPTVYLLVLQKAPSYLSFRSFSIQRTADSLVHNAQYALFNLGVFKGDN